MGTLFLTKEARIYNGKDNLFNKCCWDKWTTTCKRMNLGQFLTPYTKLNLKWIKDINVTSKTIKLLKENIGRTLDDINHKILYDSPLQVMKIKTKVNKWDLIKLKSFCTAQETINKVKRQPSEWEKIKAKKQLIIYKVYKQLMQVNTRKTNNLIKKWEKVLNRYFSKKTYR